MHAMITVPGSASTILTHVFVRGPGGRALRREEVSGDMLRWFENSLDELKTYLPGARIDLRSKTPDLVRQECHDLMMADFAIRRLIHEAALKADEDPDRLSFVHAVHVVRRKLPAAIAIPSSEKQGLP